jgi:1-acyl-sn-glycerol-3-phosphate acyltransferase
LDGVGDYFSKFVVKKTIYSDYSMDSNQSLSQDIVSISQDAHDERIDDACPRTAADPQPLIKIDVAGVLREKLGRRARFIPRFLVRKLEKTICQEQLNELMAHNYPKTGVDFCRGVISDLDVTVNVIGAENLPRGRRVLIVSNHPLGGLDGMALIRFFGEHYGEDVRFVVNDILMAVKPLNNVFLPINKHGGQSRQSLIEIDRVMESDAPVLIFPAGLVSRLGADGSVRDLEWQKMFVQKALKYNREIVPVYFDGENSRFFYKFAKFRKRSGLKFNIEMIYLPREVFNSAHRTFSIVCGEPISVDKICPTGVTPLQAAARIKDIVYKLKDRVTKSDESKDYQPD